MELHTLDFSNLTRIVRVRRSKRSNECSNKTNDRTTCHTESNARTFSYASDSQSEKFCFFHERTALKRVQPGRKTMRRKTVVKKENLERPNERTILLQKLPTTDIFIRVQQGSNAHGPCPQPSNEYSRFRAGEQDPGICFGNRLRLGHALRLVRCSLPLKQAALLITCSTVCATLAAKNLRQRIETYTTDTLSKRHCAAIDISPSVYKPRTSGSQEKKRGKKEGREKKEDGQACRRLIDQFDGRRVPLDVFMGRDASHR